MATLHFIDVTFYMALPISLLLVRRAYSTSRLSFSAQRMRPMEGFSLGHFCDKLSQI